MDPDPPPCDPHDAAWFAAQRKWASGWRRVVFPAVFLVYLFEVAADVEKYSHGAAAVVGYAALAGFVPCYLLAQPATWHSSRRRFWAPFAAAVALVALEVPFARDGTFVMCVFLTVLLVARLGARAAPAVIGLTLLALLIPPAVPSWHDHLTTSVDNGSALAIPLVSLAMFGFFNVLRANRALAEARSELARLAAENERSRIARDLHDLLGHSLTTITVKAELARRLASSDVAGALREIGEVETLGRRALADVRAAVANYREVTLVGELATGRELLRAAGIAADFPTAAEVVGAAESELFGWVLREGLTNVVRHSHATTCTVRISPRTVEILDDGVGGQPRCGNGLSGLRERVQSAGGVVEAGPAHPVGWRVSATLATDGGGG